MKKRLVTMYIASCILFCSLCLADTEKRVDKKRDVFLQQYVRRDVPAAVKVFTMGRALLCDAESYSNCDPFSVYEGYDNEILIGNYSYDFNTLDVRRRLFTELDDKQYQIFHCSDKLNYYCLNGKALHSIQLDNGETRCWQLLDFRCEKSIKDILVSKLDNIPVRLVFSDSDRVYIASDYCKRIVIVQLNLKEKTARAIYNSSDDKDEKFSFSVRLNGAKLAVEFVTSEGVILNSSGWQSNSHNKCRLCYCLGDEVRVLDFDADYVFPNKDFTVFATIKNFSPEWSNIIVYKLEDGGLKKIGDMHLSEASNSILFYGDRLFIDSFTKLTVMSFTNGAYQQQFAFYGDFSTADLIVGNKLLLYRFGLGLLNCDKLEFVYPFGRGYDGGSDIISYNKWLDEVLLIDREGFSIIDGKTAEVLYSAPGALSYSPENDLILQVVVPDKTGFDIHFGNGEEKHNEVMSARMRIDCSNKRFTFYPPVLDIDCEFDLVSAPYKECSGVGTVVGSLRKKELEKKYGRDAIVYQRDGVVLIRNAQGILLYYLDSQLVERQIPDEFTRNSQIEQIRGDLFIVNNDYNGCVSLLNAKTQESMPLPESAWTQNGLILYHSANGESRVLLNVEHKTKYEYPIPERWNAGKDKFAAPMPEGNRAIHYYSSWIPYILVEYVKTEPDDMDKKICDFFK